MAKRVIENEYLKVTVDDHGAELISVYDKENNLERIWNADPAVWNRHAPVLFPFVGRVYGNTYLHDGKEYEMKTQHGFARDMMFEFVAGDENSVTHSLKANEDTLKIYPFDFELHITHRFDSENKRMLKIDWKIINNGEGNMYYSIGGHPGFRIPTDYVISREDYSLEFPEKASLHYILINPESGNANVHDRYPLVLNRNACHIARNMFDRDALIFENHQIPMVRILKPDRTPFITMDCKGFPYLGIWSKGEQDFICLEPWYGRTDDDKFTGELKDKKGEMVLASKEEANIGYTIEFHK